MAAGEKTGISTVTVNMCSEVHTGDVLFVLGERSHAVVIDPETLLAQPEPLKVLAMVAVGQYFRAKIGDTDPTHHKATWHSTTDEDQDAGMPVRILPSPTGISIEPEDREFQQALLGRGDVVVRAIYPADAIAAMANPA